MTGETPFFPSEVQREKIGSPFKKIGDVPETARTLTPSLPLLPAFFISAVGVVDPKQLFVPVCDDQVVSVLETSLSLWK